MTLVDPLASLDPAPLEPRPTSTALASYSTPSAQLQAMLAWALSNPFGSAAEAAGHFGIQRHIAARIMNCDAFKVAYANALKAGEGPGGHTLQEKITGAIAQGVELLAENMEVGGPRFLLGAVQTLAKLQEITAPRAMPGDQQPINLTVNNQVVALGEARGEMLDRARAAGPYPGDASRPQNIATNATPYPDRADE